MNIRSKCAVTRLVITFLFCWIPALAETQSKQPIRILFVEGTKDYGRDDVDPARAVDFRKFLETNFAVVTMVRDIDFTPEVANDSDVIIVDGDIRDRVPADFHRPMVLLGADFCPIMIAETRGYKLHNL